LDCSRLTPIAAPRRPTDGAARGSQGGAQSQVPSNRTNCPTNRRYRWGGPRALTQIRSRALEVSTALSVRPRTDDHLIKVNSIHRTGRHRRHEVPRSTCAALLLKRVTEHGFLRYQPAGRRYGPERPAKEAGNQALAGSVGDFGRGNCPSPRRRRKLTTATRQTNTGWSRRSGE
jgi:hypothetical protein